MPAFDVVITLVAIIKTLQLKGGRVVLLIHVSFQQANKICILGTAFMENSFLVAFYFFIA